MSDEHTRILGDEFRHAGLSIPQSVQKLLVVYWNELERWNKKLNLTSLTGHNLARRLIVQPVWTAVTLEISGTVVDIGSGNGSPGIPIRASRELQAMHLVEARTRRAAFLRHLTTNLKLQNTHVHKARFKEVVEAVGLADWITLQAVSPSVELLEAVRQIQKPTTTVVWTTSGESAQARFPAARILNTPFSGSAVVLL